MTTLSLTDRITFDAPKRTSDGYMAVRAAAARTGIYDYLASEVDAPADRFKASDTVKIYRDPAEVFSEDSMRSFIGRPITDDHPNEAVTSDNWRRHSRGTIMSAGRKTAKDGDFLAFDLVFMDSKAIAKVDAGKRELSNGYNCEVDWTPGVTEDGEAYDARQINIRGNHVALVDRGRAGAHCRVGDGVRSSFPETEANTQLVADLSAHRSSTTEGRVKLSNLDTMVNLTDQTATEQALSALDNKVTAALGTATALQTQLDELKGEKTALETKLADAEKRTSPASIDKMVADRTDLIATAKLIAKDVDTTGKTDAEIKRAVVEAKLGDRAEGMEDGEVSGAFRLLAADADKDQKAVNDRKPTVLDSIREPKVHIDSAAVRDTVRDLRYA